MLSILAAGIFAILLGRGIGRRVTGAGAYILAVIFGFFGGGGAAALVAGLWAGLVMDRATPELVTAAAMGSATLGAVLGLILAPFAAFLKRTRMRNGVSR